MKMNFILLTEKNIEILNKRYNSLLEYIQNDGISFDEKRRCSNELNEISISIKTLTDILNQYENFMRDSNE